MIRIFKPNDITEIMEIWLYGNLHAHHFIDSAYWHDHYQEVRDMMLGTTIYVFEEEMTICGFIGLFDDEIAGIFVREEDRNKGIGKALLAYVKEYHKQLILHVYEQNQRAYHFYVKEGFCIKSEQFDEMVQENEYVMVWNI